MRVVPLASTPNQSFTLTIDDVRWTLAVKVARGVMCADVGRDGVLLLSGVRVVAGEPIIPYAYLQTGNFLFLTIANEMPDYRAFGVSQSLVYLSAAEIAGVPAWTVGEALAASAQVGYLFTDKGLYLTTDAGELLTDA